MRLLHDFKEFAVRGNVIDMAVGIIIGGAFGKIVGSLVNDLVMPPIGVLINNLDFSRLHVVIGHKLVDGKDVETTVNYGAFLTNVLDFLIVAFVIFLLVRWINALERLEESGVSPSPTTKACPYCIATIPIQATRCPQCTSQLRPAL